MGGSIAEPSAKLLDELATVGGLVTDSEILEGYRRDQCAPDLVPNGRPAALVRPRTTAEVQRAVRAAASHGVPIVPRGAGSGLSGGAAAVDGCVVLSLEAMTDIAIDESSLVATAQAGVLNGDLKRSAAEVGLFYPPDPASSEFCTIGGNVATNAGGLCCVRYGVTRDALLGLEVVLADGRVVELGRWTRKGVVGYDLPALLCGSEGTLGVITRATLRLQPTPPPASTLAASFPDIGRAGRAVARIVRQLVPSLLELMDATTVAAVQAFQPMDLGVDVGALLFARADRGTGEVERMAAACEEAGASLVVSSDDEAEGRMLLAARRLAYPALERLGTTLLDDVSVPVGQIPALVEGITAIADRRRLTIGVFGHAGDGNLHPTIVFDHRAGEQVARARLAFADILDLTGRLGGTVTGEHGVGTLKRAAAIAEIGDGLDMHRAIKRALDPTGLFNPGKLL